MLDFKAKIPQILFLSGLHHRSSLWNLQHFTRHLAVCKGPTSNLREGEGKRRGGWRKWKRAKGGKGRDGNEEREENDGLTITMGKGREMRYKKGEGRETDWREFARLVSNCFECGCSDLLRLRIRGLKRVYAFYANPSQSRLASPLILDHTALGSLSHNRWTCPAITSAKQTVIVLDLSIYGACWGNQTDTGTQETVGFIE